jgi:transcriptional regulator with XRE-family HTH domain
MTAAEYRTMRAGLGLTALQVAELAGVQPRTVERWEAGSAHPRTDDVAMLLRTLDRKVCDEVRAIVDRPGTGPHSLPVLLRYGDGRDLLPDGEGALARDHEVALALHTAIIERARETLALANRPCRIVWFEPDAYGEWLAGRADTMNTRTLWAATVTREELV